MYGLASLGRKETKRAVRAVLAKFEAHNSSPRTRTRAMAAPLIFQQAKALLIEMGASRRLGELVRGMGSKRTLLVTDPGVRGAGLLEESVESLLVAGVHVTVFDKTVPDPSESLVLECAAFARDEGVDSVVGFGGGSSMDIAKLVALLASPTSSQPLDEMFGVGNARGERLPLVQVPTTAGTGSEVTPISIITTGAAEKKGVVSPLLLPDVAVLDGDLTLSLPAPVSAASGIDAMVHAIEAYTSRLHKNPLSDVYAREALRLLSANIVQVCDDFQKPSGALGRALPLPLTLILTLTRS